MIKDGRIDRTPIDKFRSIIYEHNLSPYLWQLILLVICCLRNTTAFSDISLAAFPVSALHGTQQWQKNLTRSSQMATKTLKLVFYGILLRESDVLQHFRMSIYFDVDRIISDIKVILVYHRMLRGPVFCEDELVTSAQGRHDEKVGNSEAVANDEFLSI